MHPLWPTLPEAGKLLVAFHEAGHAISALALRVRFSEVVIGPYATRAKGFGYVVYSAVSMVEEAHYARNYLVSIFSGAAGVKALCSSVSDPDLAEVHKLGTEKDLDDANRIATRHLRLAADNLAVCFAQVESDAGNLIRDPKITAALDNVADDLLKKRRLTEEDVRILCLDSGMDVAAGL